MALLVVIFLSHGEASARTADSAPTSIRGASREYAPKPGDFTIHGTLYPNYRPGVLSVIPITGHPQVSMVVRVDETMFGESPWKAGEFLRFLVSDPDVLLAGRWRTRGQYAMTFSRFQPTTEDEKAWFKPETKYVLRSIAPVAAKAAPAREANSAGDANPAEGFESTEEAPDRAVLAMEFVDRETGWLLTVPSSAEGVPIEILRTQNGGSRFSSLGALDLTFAWLANWEQEPRTRPAVGQLRFLDRVHGWMFAPDLVATHDGGRTWSAEGRVVGALVPTAHAIWAIEGRYGKRVVIRSMDSGKSWVETPAP